MVYLDKNTANDFRETFLLFSCFHVLKGFSRRKKMFFQQGQLWSSCIQVQKDIPRSSFHWKFKNWAWLYWIPKKVFWQSLWFQLGGKVKYRIKSFRGELVERNVKWSFKGKTSEGIQRKRILFYWTNKIVRRIQNQNLFMKRIQVKDS